MKQVYLSHLKKFSERYIYIKMNRKKFKAIAYEIRPIDKTKEKPHNLIILDPSEDSDVLSMIRDRTSVTLNCKHPKFGNMMRDILTNDIKYYAVQYI